MVELTKRQERVLTKRLKAKEVSDKKMEAAKKKAEADKYYKVFVHIGVAEEGKGRPAKAVLVKAKSKDAAVKSAGESAFQAFEVTKDYKLPEAKPKKPIK